MTERWLQDATAAKAEAPEMNDRSTASSTDQPSSAAGMMIALSPWLLFSVMTHRIGVDAAGYAALTAAALGVLLLVRSLWSGGGVKILDVTGIMLFGLLSVVAFVGGPAVRVWVADYGRAGATFVVAAVMLASVAVVPFTEQYARASVPREYWSSATFRATNRAISLAWGAAVLVMAFGHTIAALADPTSAPRPGMRPIDLIFNWLLPVMLIAAAVRYTNTVAARAGDAGPADVR